MKSQREAYRNPVELVQGAVDMLDLQALQWGPIHGYGIAQTIRLKSGEMLQVRQGPFTRRSTGSNDWDA